MKYSYILAGVMSSALLFSSCSLPGAGQKDFSSVYQGHTERVFSEFEKTFKDSSLAFEGEEKVQLRIAGDVPAYGSGEFFTHIQSRSQSWKSASLDMSLTGQLNMMGETLVINSIKGSIISLMGDLYGKMDTIDMTGGLANGMDMTPIKKYLGKWISLKQTDMTDDPEALLAAKIQSNIYRLSANDIKDNMIKYPIFRSVGTGGIVGNNYVYDVELDKENASRFIIAMYEKLSESGATESMKKDIAEGFSGMTIKGKLAVDKDDLLYFTFTGVVIPPDSQSGADIVASLGRDTFRFSLMNQGNGISLDGKKAGEKWTSLLQMLQEGKSIGSFTFVNDTKTLFSLTGSVQVEGMMMTADYIRSDDGSFNGSIVLPMGNTIKFSGKSKDDALLAFTLDANLPEAGSITMNLAPSSDGWIAGPLVVKEGTNEVVKADVKILMKKNTFGLRADITPTGMPIKMHFEMDSNSVRTPSKVTIEAPKDTIPFKTISEELGIGSSLVPSPDMYPSEDSYNTFDDMGMEDMSGTDLPLPITVTASGIPSMTGSAR